MTSGVLEDKGGDEQVGAGCWCWEGLIAWGGLCLGPFIINLQGLVAGEQQKIPFSPFWRLGVKVGLRGWPTPGEGPARDQRPRLCPQGGGAGAP